MSYKSTRRQWVKLWVNEWLDGTTRFELTAPQRLLWIDLLALAGRSRFPGWIYAGHGEDNKKVGYPIAYLAGVLQMDEVALNNALKLLQTHCRITLDEIAPEQYVIGIINWEKYQSEYLRQKAYRKVTPKTTSRLPVEGEEEVEVTNKNSIAEGSLPEWLPLLLWKSYVDMRKRIKHPLTAAGIDIQIQKLRARRDAGENIVELLEQAISGSWIDFKPAGKEKTNGRESFEERQRRKSRSAISEAYHGAQSVVPKVERGLPGPRGDKAPDGNVRGSPRRPIDRAD
jgi:hypothetical protein